MLVTVKLQVPLLVLQGETCLQQYRARKSSCSFSACAVQGPNRQRTPEQAISPR